MPMQRNIIKTVTSVTAEISNHASGDIVFFDIDETLILTGLNKFSPGETPSKPPVPFIPPYFPFRSGP